MGGLMRRCFQQMALIAVIAGGLCCPAFAVSVVQADSMEAAQSLRGATYEPAPTRVDVQKPRKLGTAPVAPPAQSFRQAGTVLQKSIPAAPSATRPAKQH